METMQFFGHFFVEHTNGKRVRVVYKDNGVTLGLRSIKEHPDMSDETICYSATLDINGRKAGYAYNDGRGGCSSVNFDHNRFHETFNLIQKPKDYLCREDILDNLVYLSLDFAENAKKGIPLERLVKEYPHDYLW